MLMLCLICEIDQSNVLVQLISRVLLTVRFVIKYSFPI